MFLEPLGLPLGFACVCGGVLNSSGELGESYACAEVPRFGVETLAGGVVLALCCDLLSSDTGLNPESLEFTRLNTGLSSSELSLKGGSSATRSGSGCVSSSSTGCVGF